MSTLKLTTTVTFTEAQTYAVYSALLRAKDEAITTLNDEGANQDRKALAAASFVALERSIAALVTAATIR